MKFFALATAFWLGMFSFANAQDYDFEEAEERLTNEVAGKFYDPGPTFVSKVLAEMRFLNAPDLGMNLTSITTYGVGNVLFGDNYHGVRPSDINDRDDSLAQHVIISSIRGFLSNPTNLTGLWYQVKSTAVPVVLNKIGQTRVNTWLSPASALFVEGGFDPAFGKTYEDWRTNGCQWYLQIDPSPAEHYTPKMTEEDCANHKLVKDLRGEGAVVDDTFVNTAHWYGFLWRRYLEGDIGLVAAWQSILNDIALAARSS